jgi:HK97 family phage major capsid protein
MEFDPQKLIEGMNPFLHHISGLQDPTYYDPWRGIDYSPQDFIKKNKIPAAERAIWNYTSGSIVQPVVLPTFLSDEYVYALPVDAPAYAATPKRASKGATVEYVRITAYGAPSAYFVAQDTAPDYVSPTAARVTLKKAICETWGGTTGFLEASGQPYKNILEEAVGERLKAMLSNALEDQCLNGGGTGNDAKGFLTYQGTTNGVTAGSAAVTLTEIRDALKLAYDAGGDLENYGFAITDPATYNYVKSLLTEWMGYVDVLNYDLPWGLKTFAVDGMPFLKSRKMPTGANVKKILMLDRRHNYAAILTDVTTELYGRTKDATEFAIKWYGNFVADCVEYNAVVHTIA